MYLISRGWRMVALIGIGDLMSKDVLVYALILWLIDDSRLIEL
jgi:hypothetical protein